jgi:ankyrin repeat protein
MVVLFLSRKDIYLSNKETLLVIDRESRLVKYYDYMFAIQEYLSGKLDPLITKEDENTPIHIALITKRFRAALFLLINIPTLDGIKNKKMQTWIHTLAYSEINETEFNECNYWLYLEGRQIELNVRDKYGNTPLHYAAMKSNNSSIMNS